MPTFSWLNSMKKQLVRGLQSKQRRSRRQRYFESSRGIEQVESRLLLSAVVVTNQDDYAPGSTALITASNDTAAGTNFANGELVQFQVARTDGIADYPSGNLPWYVTDGVAGFEPYEADINNDGTLDRVFPDTNPAAGAVGTSWFVEDQYANSSLQLTAIGQASGAVAKWDFTDANTISTTISPTSATGSTVFTMIVTNNIGGTTMKSIDINIPNSIVVTSVSTSPSWTNTSTSTVLKFANSTGLANGSSLTITFTATPSGGTDTWTMTGHSNAGFNGANFALTSPVTVTSKINTTTVNNGVPSGAVYDGATHAITGVTVSGPGLIPGAVVVTTYFDTHGTVDTADDTALGSAPTNAGHYKVVSTYAGDATRNGSNDTDFFDIAKATAAINVGGYSTPYDGMVHGLSGSASGVDGDLSAFLSYGAGVTNVPGGLVTWSFDAGPNYNTASGSSLVTITKVDATVVVTPYDVPYDTFSHTATYTIAGVNGEMGATVGSVTLNTTHTIAGTYATDSWSFTGTGNYNNISSTTITDIIRARCATVNYIGQTTFVTSGTSATTAQVTLTASMQDPTGTGLVGATVDFIWLDGSVNGKVLASGVTVSQVPGNPSTGTANKIVTLSTGQYGSESYLILVRLTGNYTNSSQASTDKTATVVVSKMAATSEIIGGGNIANLVQNGTSGKAGLYGQNASGQTAYSIGLKYNKSGTNPQGKIALSIEQAGGSTVYIKSNSISSIAVTAATVGKDAVVYTKCSIYKVDSSGVTTTLDGGATLRVDLHDEAGSTYDKIGFTVLSSKTSTLAYSNNWFYDATKKLWSTKTQSGGSFTIS